MDSKDIIFKQKGLEIDNNLVASLSRDLTTHTSYPQIQLFTRIINKFV